MNPCVYCGEPADTQDHVMPAFWRSTRVTVCACVNCNSTLCHHALFTIQLRASFMAGVLHREYVRKKRGDTDAAVLLLDRITWALGVAAMSDEESATHVRACSEVRSVRALRRPETTREEGDGGSCIPGDRARPGGTSSAAGDTGSLSE